PAERNPRENSLECLVREQFVRHRRIDDRGRNGIHRDLVRPELARESFGQGYDPGLCRGIKRVAEPRSAETEAMLMMRPECRCFIAGIAAFTQYTMPARFTCETRSHSLAGRSATGPVDN